MKKAQTGFIINMLVSFAMLFVVCAAIAGIVLYHIDIDVDSRKAQADLFVEQLLFSQNAIAKRDAQTTRIDPTTIDKEKIVAFTKEYEEKNNNGLSAKITLGKEAPLFLNKRVYERLAPAKETKFRITGEYPAGAYVYKIPVFVDTNNKVTSETLQMMVIVT